MSLKSQVFFLSVSALILGAATAAQADLTISSDATQNMSCSGGVCQPTAADAVLNAGDLENLLASGNVKVSTTGSGVQAGNIDVTAKLGWSKNALTLDSYQSLNVTAPVTIKGKSGLSILTNDGGSGGELAFSGKGHATFKDLSGKLSINGASYTLASSIALLAADIQDDPSGNFALASDYNAKKDGKYGNSPITTDLKGTVDGLGNTISNLTIDIPKVRRDTQWVGLFEGVEGRISNIQLKNISGKAESVAGGRAALVLGTLAGESSGTISRCYTDGSLTSPRESGIGGLVGENDGVITESAANVNVTMQKDYGALGGLAGGNTGQITISFATGSVTFEGDADEDSLGALVGVNHNGTIYNSYATGAVTGGQASGGLVGTNDSDIGESYSIGTVSAGTWVGGLIGNDESQSGSLSDTYWDTTTSGISSPSQGAGNVANDPGITGLTNDQLQSALPAGFDSAVWGENSAINGGLPYLLANPPQ